jgi:hypothetical protein
MRALPHRAAAYTRTGILRRFLDQLSEALPARVDNAYAETRLGLKGGDVRAFLQSLRVLGIIDPYGALTERARRTRGQSQRAAAMREALEEAYPELTLRWEARGGMPRDEVEDFFKVEYGLSASSAGPAAKLFVDLMREYSPRERGEGRGERVKTPAPAAREEASAPGASSAAPLALSPTLPPAADVRLAALDAIKSSLRIDINAEWDEERIQLVFDRMERLVDRILTRA